MCQARTPARTNLERQPNFEDAWPDPAVGGDAMLAYAYRTVALRRELARAIDLLDEIEPDGCYVGEGHPKERQLKSLVAGLLPLYEALEESGRGARNEQ